MHEHLCPARTCQCEDADAAEHPECGTQSRKKSPPQHADSAEAERDQECCESDQAQHQSPGDLNRTNPRGRAVAGCCGSAVEHTNYCAQHELARTNKRGTQHRRHGSDLSLVAVRHHHRGIHLYTFTPPFFTLSMLIFECPRYCFFNRDVARARADCSSSTLRMRTFSGVTSTHSSSRANSRHSSSDSCRGGVIDSKLSAVDERMFVSFFSFVMLTSMSSAREFSPITMPSQTSSVGLTKKLIRSCSAMIANGVTPPERSATIDPLLRVTICPAQASYPCEMAFAIPVPRVVVRNSVRKPMRPRLGTMNSMRTHPVPWLDMFSIRPLRAANNCVIAPR